jgi:phage shock protein PspC (stress-responsive transcriptional regulator)
MLCGVCGGIAEYFEVDSAIIRLLMAVFALTGTGIIFYIFAAIIIHEKIEPTISYGHSPAGASYASGGAETYSGEFSGETPQDAGSAEADATSRKRPLEGGGKGSGVMILGLILIIIGVFYLINRFVPIFNWIDIMVVFAVLLVIVGIYFVAKR